MLAASNRLKRRNDFRRVYTRGASRAYAYFVIYRCPTRRGECRVGFSVSKKIGSAVTRNRAKRRMRAVCRELIDIFAAGYDYIFILRGALLDAEHQQLKAQVTQAVKAINEHGGRR